MVPSSMAHSRLLISTRFFIHFKKTCPPTPTFKALLHTLPFAMACTSIQSSSSSRARNFDVFVSFRGEDTRNSFTDHLFAALQRKSIVAFRDDQKIKKGELIGPELEQAIEGSRVFIVVFSKNYASSTWCLQELAKIVDWVEVTGQSVLPVFYDVTPSEVRKQSGSFGKHFVEHEERFKDDLKTVEKWREALKAVANRLGWDVQNMPQHEEIEKIVQAVADILCYNQILSCGDDLVDMDSRVERLEQLLDLRSDEVVRVVGICGMGGIGKTTLAMTLFNKIYHQFDTCCFIDDVSKIYMDSGSTGLQKELLRQALNQENMQINHLSHGTMLVRTRLCHLKALIVLDNVDQIEQLEKLALNPRFLGVGSRIIITSRDSHILRNHGVNEIYSAQLLDTNKALQLLSKKAFKSRDIEKDYKKLAYDVIQYANGLPLAIKVLGSFLFDRDIFEWKTSLARLKENPNKNIMDVLRISFDGLEDMEKEIFLDIACFSFKYRIDRGYVENILDYRGFYPKIGLRVLIDKSLITIDKYRICMHDLLKELGKGIVREKSPKEPRKWSRLWDYEDLHNITLENKDANSVEAIVIQLWPDEFLQTMRVDALSKMNHLNVLIIKGVNFSGSLNFISNELRYLSWDRYPFMSLPASFHPKKLVELILPHSSIKQLWKDTKDLPNLKILDLSHSKNLIEMPNLRGVPRLKELILEGCVEIVRIDPSIGTLRELSYLDLKNCKNLVLNLDIIFGLSSLENLNLSGCSKLLNNHLSKKPRQVEYLEKLDIEKSVIQFHPTSSIYKLLMLPFSCFSSQELEDPLGVFLPYLSRFPSLSIVDLSFCNLLQIPDAIGSLHSLVRLDLGGNKFVTLPNCIKELPRLRSLNLQHCKQLKYLPELPSTKIKNGVRWGRLYIFDCPNLREIEGCYRMVLSWMKQLLEGCSQSSSSGDHISIVIPGTEIPRWFSKQNMGSSISMDPSPDMEASNWIGVACCAVFVAHDDPTTLGFRPPQDHHIGFSIHKKGMNGVQWIVPILFKKDLITVETNHLLIVFFTQEEVAYSLSPYSNELVHGLDNLEFTVHVEHTQGLHLEVKNCGYRWVFKEDLQQLNPNMMFRGNSSSRKCKFLTSD